VRHCASIVELIVVHGLFINMKLFDGVHHGAFVTIWIPVMQSSIGRKACWWSRGCFANLDLFLLCV
jgi:hypothetical protein